MADFGVPGGDARHKAALQWFAERVGQEVAWPEPLDGMFLVNKAKGIHKPKELNHALSIRQSLSGPYEDALHLAPDGSWFLEYAHEGKDPNYFTNRALHACLTDNVPVGVFVQVKEKPHPRYKVLGLGDVIKDDGGVFTIRQHGVGASRPDAAVDVLLTSATFDATNSEDARKRELRSIALRRGQPAFRRALFAAYRGRCAVTGCSVSAVLEAAHIIPYLGDHTNHVQNGVLMRADIHTLFDLGLISISAEPFTIQVADELKDSEYWLLQGKALSLPTSKAEWPSTSALLKRQLLAQ